MVVPPSLQQRLDELASREWDVPAIQARVRKMIQEGIPPKKLDPQYMKVHRTEILDRVQRRAEEYNYFFRNCAQGTATALFEEFGLGSMEVVKALTAFPGIGSTGETCGGITGSLVAFGLVFGPDSPPDPEKTGKAIQAAQDFMARFENEVGYRRCSDIIENVIIGRKLNPGESEESMLTFEREKGFEKCCLLPGTGARLAAEIIIDRLSSTVP